MKKTILELSQTLYGMEFDEETNIVYYDGELIAKLSESDTIISNGIAYYGDTKNEKLITVLSLSEYILSDYIHSTFGYDYQSFQQFLVSISDTIDLFDIVEGVTLIENLEKEDLQEVRDSGIFDEIVFYDGSSFHEIDDTVLNEFIISIYDELVLFTDTNNVMPCDSSM